LFLGVGKGNLGWGGGGSGGPQVVSVEGLKPSLVNVNS